MNVGNIRVVRSVCREVIEGVQLCLSRFGHYSIKPYIPRIWLDFLDFLAGERDADELRMKPVAPGFEERETGIEIASAHADSMAVIVECDDRSDDHVDCCRFNRLA